MSRVVKSWLIILAFFFTLNPVYPQGIKLDNIYGSANIGRIRYNFKCDQEANNFYNIYRPWEWVVVYKTFNFLIMPQCDWASFYPIRTRIFHCVEYSNGIFDFVWRTVFFCQNNRLVVFNSKNCQTEYYLSLDSCFVADWIHQFISVDRQLKWKGCVKFKSCQYFIKTPSIQCRGFYNIGDIEIISKPFFICKSRNNKDNVFYLLNFALQFRYDVSIPIHSPTIRPNKYRSLCWYYDNSCLRHCIAIKEQSIDERKNKIRFIFYGPPNMDLL